MKRKFRKLIIPTAIIVLQIIALVIVGSRWLDNGNNGTIRIGDETTNNTLAKTRVTLQTAYFTSRLPDEFSVRSRNDEPLRVVAVSGEPSQQIGIIVDKIPANGLAEIGDYNLRVKTPTSYSPFDLPSAQAGMVAFRTINGPAAFTVFWPHGIYYAEITLSSDGASNFDELLASYQQIFADWSWN